MGIVAKGYTLKIIYLPIIILGLGQHFACSQESNFKGQAKIIEKASNDAAPEPPDEIVAVPAPEPEPVPPPQEIVAPAPMPSPVITLPPVDTIEIPKVCKEKLQYDPSEILCSLPIDGSKSLVWQGVWDSSWMTNNKAEWISPLAALTEGNGKQYCPYLPGAEKVVYVSHFKIAAEDELTIQTLIDDQGQIRLWKDADPKKQVFISTLSHKSNDKVKLQAGFYTIVMDGVDTAQYASAAVASVLDSKGNVLSQTDTKADWCIFRLSANQDVAEFLLSAAACKSCMVGKTP